MDFKFVMKRCRKCGCDFVTSDDRAYYCDDCCWMEDEPFLFDW